MRVRTAAIGSFLAAMCLAWLAPGAVAADPIRFEGTEAIEVSMPGGAEAQVALLNATSEPITVTWTVVLQPTDGTSPTATVVPSVASAAPNALTYVTLTISGVSEQGRLAGTLVATPELAPAGDGAPGLVLTRPLTIVNPALGFVLSGWGIIAAAAALGFGVVALRYSRRPAYKPGPISNPQWSFSASWASSLTAVGALLATVSAAGLLPVTGALLGKEELAGVSILFASMILFAPIAYSALARPGGTDAEPTIGNGVRIFHLAAWLTATAVFGQTTAVLVLLADAFSQDGSLGAVLVVSAAELVTTALLARYLWVTIPRAIAAGQIDPGAPPTVRVRGIVGAGEEAVQIALPRPVGFLL